MDHGLKTTLDDWTQVPPHLGALTILVGTLATARMAIPWVAMVWWWDSWWLGCWLLASLLACLVPFYAWLVDWCHVLSIKPIKIQLISWSFNGRITRTGLWPHSTSIHTSRTWFAWSNSEITSVDRTTDAVCRGTNWDPKIEWSMVSPICWSMGLKQWVSHVKTWWFSVVTLEPIAGMAALSKVGAKGIPQMGPVLSHRELESLAVATAVRPKFICRTICLDLSPGAVASCFSQLNSSVKCGMGAWHGGMAWAIAVTWPRFTAEAPTFLGLLSQWCQTHAEPPTFGPWMPPVDWKIELVRCHLLLL